MILASKSPRRRELLSLLTAQFTVFVSDADETIPESMPPEQAVELLACRKAKAVFALYPNETVIGADTIVVVDGRILGKPDTPQQAKEMLRMLSGREHQVLTGVAVFTPGKTLSFSKCTHVLFSELSETEIEWYVSTGDCMDKAGAYGIQGVAARFISAIQGDFYNVMGLPVQALYDLFSRHQIRF